MIDGRGAYNDMSFFIEWQCVVSMNTQSCMMYKYVILHTIVVIQVLRACCGLHSPFYTYYARVHYDVTYLLQR